MNEFKVLTYNLKCPWFYEPKARLFTRQAMALLKIKETGADIIGVQELLPQIKQLIFEKAADYRIVGLGRNKDLSGEHADILFKEKDVSAAYSHTFWLSKNPSKQGSRAYFSIIPRICTVAELEFKDTKQKVRVFNTHLDHLCYISHTLGVRLILRTMMQLNEKEYMPSIIMGDMNANPKSRAIRLLRENLHGHEKLCFVDAYKACFPDEVYRNTVRKHALNKTSRHIDYIFVTEDVEVLRFEILEDKDNISDHYPILATLRLKEKEIR